VKEVKEIEQSVVQHNVSSFGVLTLFEEGPGCSCCHKTQKGGQVLMSSVVYDVVLRVHCKDSVCFGGLWGVHNVQKAASSSSAEASKLEQLHLVTTWCVAYKDRGKNGKGFRFQLNEDAQMWLGIRYYSCHFTTIKILFRYVPQNYYRPLLQAPITGPLYSRIKHDGKE
jgi:hypothetical protein